MTTVLKNIDIGSVYDHIDQNGHEKIIVSQEFSDRYYFSDLSKILLKFQVAHLDINGELTRKELVDISDYLVKSKLLSLKVSTDCSGPEFVLFINTLKNNITLVKLYLEINFCDVCQRAYDSIVDLFITNKIIKTFSFNNLFHSYDDSKLLDVLEKSTSLEKLIFYRSDFCCPGFRVNNSLKKLDFNHCCFDNDTFRSMMLSLGDNTTLKCLRFEYCTFGTDNISDFCEMIDHNVDISKLCISCCDMSYYDVIRSIENNKGITELHMRSSEDISDNEAQEFAEMLLRNNTIKTLVLASNSIKNAGTIFQALKYNFTLENLDLSDNMISNTSELAEMLKCNNTLKNLNIANNDMMSNVLKEALEYNYSLETLVGANELAYLLTPENRQQKYRKRMCYKRVR